MTGTVRLQKGKEQPERGGKKKIPPVPEAN